VVLLTLAEDIDGQPPLCSLLATLGFGVRRRVGASPHLPILDAALVPLEAGGFDAAMLQIVAPGVLTLPDSWDDPDWSADNAGDDADDLWRNACALWQPAGAMRAAA
jgi:hypothetical protein